MKKQFLLLVNFSLVVLIFGELSFAADLSKWKTNLNHDSPEVRQQALLELAKINSTEGNKLIIGALEDTSPFVRKHAAYFLGKIGEKNGIVKLSEIIYFDQSQEVSIFAAEALYVLGLKSGLKVLISLIDSDNVSIALLAMEKLETIGAQSALPELQKVAKKKDPIEIHNRATKAYKVIKGEIKIETVRKTRAIIERIYTKLGTVKAEEIEKEIQKAKKLDANYPDIYWILGNLHYNDATKWRQALVEFKKAKDLGYTERSNLFFAMGTIYLNLGQFSNAIQVLKQAASEKKEADIYYQLGVVYSRINERQKAIKATEEAIKIDPTYTAAYYNLSQLYKSLGNRAKSTQYFEQYQLLQSKK